MAKKLVELSSCLWFAMVLKLVKIKYTKTNEEDVYRKYVIFTINN